MLNEIFVNGVTQNISIRRTLHYRKIENAAFVYADFLVTESNYILKLILAFLYLPNQDMYFNNHIFISIRKLILL